jgi:hypothetical protein
VKNLNKKANYPYVFTQMLQSSLCCCSSQSFPAVACRRADARSGVFGSGEWLALGADRGADAWCLGGVARFSSRVLGSDRSSSRDDGAWVRSNGSRDGSDHSGAWCGDLNDAVGVAGFDNRNAGGEGAPGSVRNADFGCALGDLVGGFRDVYRLGRGFWNLFGDGARKRNSLDRLRSVWLDNGRWHVHCGHLGRGYEIVSDQCGFL